MKPRVIIVDLSVSSINEAIKQVEELQMFVDTFGKNLLKALINSGVIIAKSKVINIDTGETKKSIRGVYIDGNHGMIVAGGQALWLEFGTGVIKNTGYPMQLPDGIVGHGQYGQGLGGTLDGWFYPTDDIRYAICDTEGNAYTTDDGLFIAYTKGIEANKFMYKTIMYLKKMCKIIAEDVISH